MPMYTLRLYRALRCREDAAVLSIGLSIALSMSMAVLVLMVSGSSEGYSPEGEVREDEEEDETAASEASFEVAFSIVLISCSIESSVSVPSMPTSSSVCVTNHRIQATASR